MDLNVFKELPLLAILRGISEEMVEPIAGIVSDSGIKALEITMNTPDAHKLIAQMVLNSGGNFNVGAGTVLTMHHLHLALESGASFIVTPCVDSEIMNFCVKHKIPIFPGALTPTEIHLAWEMGASMVKVFPSSVFGPKYFKEIKGPLNNIELLACGGVSKETIHDFFANGASAAAIGASIFNLDLLKAEKYDEIKILLYELLDKLLNALEKNINGT